MKKTICLLMMFVFAAAISKAQNDTLTVKSENENVFSVVEEMPEFPGGKEALSKFLVDNIKYPESSRKNNEQGIVYIHFVVDSAGNVVNAKVLKGVSADLDAEAVRVVSMMPPWKPGKQSGKKVNVFFNLPIKFSL